VVQLPPGASSAGPVFSGRWSDPSLLNLKDSVERGGIEQAFGPARQLVRAGVEQALAVILDKWAKTPSQLPFEEGSHAGLEALFPTFFPGGAQFAALIA